MNSLNDSSSPRDSWPTTDIGGSRLHLPHGTTPALDCAMWVLAISLVTSLHIDGGVHEPTEVGIGITILIAVVLQLLAWALFLRGRARFATSDEIPQILLTDVLVTAILMLVVVLAEGPLLPLGAVAVSGAVALVLHLGSRWVFQRVVEWRHRPPAHRTRRTIVLGAGYGGAQAISLMQQDQDGTFTPVAILDDDPSKRHLRISGVRVLGPWQALGQVAKEKRADLVLLAVPSAEPSMVDEVVEQANALGLDIRIMPSTEELVGKVPSRRPEASRIQSTNVFRPPQIADLLGRRAIDTDVDAIGEYLTGERVLVTGAGGSIGSHLCREIARYEPERLIMVDRDESALHAVQLSLDGEAMLDSPDLILGDLRTPGFIDALFTENRPTIVFHTASLKHVTLTERFPEEAFLTNVAATRDLLMAAASHEVQRFINISTDKAADPQCVLGYSKRVAERLTATVGRSLTPDRRFISVRFGNVLGSRGSALLTFASQLERGLPMTITDPQMERFFMSVDEACQLVLQAGVLGHSGEVLILDMGQSHNIEDIARRFSTLLGYRDARVTYTHARAGEKLAEQLFGEGEEDLRPNHPLIAQTPVPPLPMEALDAVAELRERTEWGQHGALVRRWMEAESGA
ncbi:polysaccharide biosynthesis protein [Actinomyces sp. MRS3W]|uniref:polysaccharide biosynthesis protein n=1 Tax=Actinomyces sp. MRS3W TaxID=2800796 RepID=UPI0028FD674D|nr:polysaccharide biosynthesis protein [Actinomyces sp. MRS3W]MDU0347383.1 polysaccharide biosynthesis protein [Actinomyces sp. MRS3W]